MAERLGTQLQSGGLEQSIHSGLIGSGLFGGASLDLNFAATKNLGPLVTFTRASSATYVGSDGLIKTATTNEPRFDHNPTTGESLGLLVEDQRTNLATNSESLTLGFTQQNTTVTSDATAAPDGTTTADLSVPNTTSASHASFRANITFAVSTSYALSVFVKPSGYTAFQLSFTSGFNNTNAWANFILVDGGSLGFAGTSGTATIQALSNGWYRCSLVATSGASAASGGPALIVLDSNRNGRDPFFAGNGTSGIYLWGAQLEAGAFPTSYIPTTTAAATRSADVASITGSAFSSWYRQDEGTMFARYSFPQSPNTGGARVFVFSNSAGTNLIWLRAQGGVNRIYDVTDASVSQATFNQGAYAAGVEYRAALATKANNFGFAENGGAPQSDSSGTVPSEASAETDSLLLDDSPFNDFYILGYSEASSSGVGVDRLGIGVDASGTAPGNVHIRRLTYWPQRLPNSTLVALTQ